MYRKLEEEEGVLTWKTVRGVSYHCGFLPGPWKCIHGWQPIKKISQIIKIILNRYYASRRVWRGTKRANQVHVAANNLNQTNQCKKGLVLKDCGLN